MLLAAILSACSANSGDATGLPIDTTALVAEHNAVRAQYGAADLAWSDDLATVATNWSDHLSDGCAMVHSGGDYGENLY